MSLRVFTASLLAYLSIGMVEVNAFEHKWDIIDSTDTSYREMFSLEHLNSDRACHNLIVNGYCENLPETPLILMEVCVTQFKLGSGFPIDGIEINANHQNDQFDNGEPMLFKDGIGKCQLVGMRPSMTLEVRFLTGREPHQGHSVEGTFRIVPY